MSGDHHAVPVGVPTYASRAAMYEEVIQSVKSLVDDGGGGNSTSPSSSASSSSSAATSSNEWRFFSRLATNLSNVSSVLFYALNAEFTKGKDAPLHALPVNWCGWYLLDRPDRLALGPFQGKLACTQIKLGRGFCGISALTNKDLAVADVQADARHIACDAASQSEAVIVLRDPCGRVVGVLDIDSSVRGTFTEEVDVPALRKICDIVTKAHEAELLALFRGATGQAVRAAADPLMVQNNSASVQQEQQPQPGAGGASVPISAFPGATRTAGGISAIRVEQGPNGLAAVPISSSSSSGSGGGGGAGGGAVTRPPQMVLRGGSTCSALGGASAGARPGQQRSPPTESGDLKKHRNWELRWRQVGEMLNSAGLSKLEERLEVKLLPEIIFDLNEIHFVMDDGAGVKPLKFRVCAQSSLANVVAFSSTEEYRTQVKDTLLPKDSEKWAAQRSEFATFDPKVDWAFRNRYCGVWSDGSGTEISPAPLAAVAGEEAEAAADAAALIDYDLLRRTDLPILFFASIDLWEDDLHDNGLSKLSAKARVMEPCFFVLVRHVLRVDGVKMEVRDTRHFHKFGTRKICIEQSLKTLDIAAYLESKQEEGLTEEMLHRTLMTLQVEQLTMLKEEWKKNFVISF